MKNEDILQLKSFCDYLSLGSGTARPVLLEEIKSVLKEQSLLAAVCCPLTVGQTNVCMFKDDCLHSCILFLSFFDDQGIPAPAGAEPRDMSVFSLLLSSTKYGVGHFFSLCLSL